MIMRRGFRASVLRVHGLLLAMDDVVVDAIFHIRGSVVAAIQAPVIRFVLSEEQLRGALAAELTLTIVIMLQIDDHRVPQRLCGIEVGTPYVIPPGPGITKPDRW